jgi:hypothetical protein
MMVLLPFGPSQERNKCGKNEKFTKGYGARGKQQKGAGINKGRSRWMASVAATVLIVGIFFAWWTISRADIEMREEMIRDLRLVLQALDARKVERLQFETTDSSLPEFKQLGGQMRDFSQSLRLSWVPATRYVGKYKVAWEYVPFRSREYS